MSTVSNTLIFPFGHVVSSIERKLGVKLTRRCQVSISPYYIMGAFLLSTSHHTWPLFLEQSQPALIHCHRSVKSQWVLLEVDTHHWATEMSFVGCLYFLNFFFHLVVRCKPVALIHVENCFNLYECEWDGRRGINNMYCNISFSIFISTKLRHIQITIYYYNISIKIVTACFHNYRGQFHFFFCMCATCARILSKSNITAIAPQWH